MLIAGVDEAGRGPLAGPVVAAACVLPTGFSHPEITDSKKITAKKREELYDIIQKEALSYSIVSVGHHRIDQLNIREATKIAMSLSVARIKADFVRIDGNMEIPISLPQVTVVKGDLKHIEISAASILAKVWRDRLMKILDVKYPGYNLGQHSGYPTKAHKLAVATLGPSRIHRKTFRGVKEFVSSLE